MNFKELPEISDRLTNIVNLVAQYRFINRHQFQKLYGHKDPSRLNKWLKELVNKGYLRRIYSHKLLENTKPAIYYLGNNGIVWLRWNESFASDTDPIPFNLLKKYYQDKDASESFINHCLSLFEIYLQCQETTNSTDDEDPENRLRTKSQIWLKEKLRANYEEPFEDIKELIPDLYLLKTTESESRIEEQHFFIILFDSHVPRYAMRYKVDKFIEFFDDDDHDCADIVGDGYKEIPTILIIFPTQQKMNQIGRYIAKSLAENYAPKPTFFVTTLENIMTDGLFGQEKTWRLIKSYDE